MSFEILCRICFLGKRYLSRGQWRWVLQNEFLIANLHFSFCFLLIGPLVCGINQLVGVTSWGIGCGSKPGVYARISKYVPWITEFAAKHSLGTTSTSTMTTMNMTTMSPTTSTTWPKESTGPRTFTTIANSMNATHSGAFVPTLSMASLFLIYVVFLV